MTVCAKHKNANVLPMTFLVAFALFVIGGVVGCVTAPPVLEVALADAAIRQAKMTGVDVHLPYEFNQASLFLDQSKYYLRIKKNAEARLYAIQARQLVEWAELSVMETTGLVSVEEGGIPVLEVRQDDAYFFGE